MLRRIQNELFDVGSELATPPDGGVRGNASDGEGEVSRLEPEMDRMQKELEPLKSFTLPGGGDTQCLPASGPHGMPAR